MKFLINFCFCVNKQRLRGAETILTAIYERSELILNRQKQNLKQSETEPHQPEPVHRQLFEEIKESVQKLNKTKEGSISKQIQQELLNIFIPTQGQNWKQRLRTNQAWRYQLGVNKNQLISVYPHSGLLSFIIRLLYEKNQKGKLIAPISSSFHVNYIVGTSGLGKSFKFYAIKHFHDLRIPYIIANGPDKESIFDINYKFLYFSAYLQPSNIFEMIKQELRKDFQGHQKHLQGIQNLTAENCSEWFSKIIRLYRQNHIKLKLIVDQVNILYLLLSRQKLKELKRRIEIFSNFSLSSQPVFLISSKNNSYLSAHIDPIFRIARSTEGSLRHNKYTVDDFISAEQRLLSSVECLLFELEKYGINRNLAIEIVKRVNLGFQTHFQIVSAVYTLIVIQTQNQKPAGVNEQINHLANELNKYLKFPEDSLVRAIRQAYQNIVGRGISSKVNVRNDKESLQQFINLMLHSMYFIFNNRAAEEISVSLDVKTQDNSWVKITKKADIISKSFKEEDKQIYFLRNTNFFFFHQKEGKQMMYFSISPDQLQSLKLKVIKYLNVFVLDKISKFNLRSFQQFIGPRAELSGLVFKVLICNAYYQGTKGESYVQTTFQNIDLMHKVKAKLNQIEQRNMQKYKLTYFENANIDLVKQIIGSDKSKNFMNCFTTTSMQTSFGFVLSSYQNEKLKLVFIDTTISTSERPIVSKIVKFKGKLLNNGDFNALITKLSESGQISSIQLFYYVLIPEAADDSNLYDVNQISKTESRVIQQMKKQIVELQSKRLLLKKEQLLKQVKVLQKKLKSLQEIVDLSEISEDSVKTFKEKFDKIAKIQTVVGVLGEHFIIENTKNQQAWVSVMEKFTKLRQKLKNQTD